LDLPVPSGDRRRRLNEMSYGQGHPFRHEKRKHERHNEYNAVYDDEGVEETMPQRPLCQAELGEYLTSTQESSCICEKLGVDLPIEEVTYASSTRGIPER